MGDEFQYSEVNYRDSGEEEKELLHHQQAHPQPPQRKSAKFATITGVVIVSLFLHAALAYFLYPILSGEDETSIFKNTKSSWSNHQAWVDESEYYTRHQKSRSDAAWDTIDDTIGIVAISDEEVAELGLPTSQRFPWDKTKGLYHINGYHTLHCLKNIWNLITRYSEGIPFEVYDWHVFHCIDQMRQDTLCYADSTPRYTGTTHQSNTSSGIHQQRQCRDWSKLERWALDRTACYHHMNDTVVDTRDRYKLCPEGSPYNDRIAEIFGPNERQRIIELYGNDSGD